MNGFLVFESPLQAQQFLEHPDVRRLGSSAASFRCAALQPVVTFRNVPDTQLGVLEKVVDSFGGEIQPSYRHEPVGRF